MGFKDLFTGRKQDSDCCGAQVVPDDEPNTEAASEPTMDAQEETSKHASETQRD